MEFTMKADNQIAFRPVQSRRLGRILGTNDAGITVGYDGLLSFVALHFMKLEYSVRAHVHTHNVAIALVIID